MQKLTYFNYLPVYVEYEKGSPIGLSIKVQSRAIELTYKGEKRFNVLGLLNISSKSDRTIDFEDDGSFVGVLTDVSLDVYEGKIYSMNRYIGYKPSMTYFVSSELTKAGVEEVSTETLMAYNNIVSTNIIAGNIPHFDVITREMEDYHDDEDCVEIEESEDESEFDIVEKPEHYNSAPNGIETIDAIEAAMTREEFRGYLKGTMLKYVFRLGKKDKATQDLGKSQWYLNKLMKKLEELENE